MSQENLDININVNTKGADTPIKSIREQIKQATRDVVEFSSKFGATSKEAIEAAKRVSELRDRMGDAKSLADAFNPDAKFKALTASLSGVAGGFGAVQGAMALFGAESDNVQKTLLKVQSAMAVSQGLQSVGESIDSFRQLGAVIQSTTVYQAAYNFIMGDAVEVAQEAVVSIEAETTALNAEAVATVEVATATTAATIAMRIFRAALIATGIGAIVLLFGFLIEQLDLFTSDTKKAKEAQDALNASLSAMSENLNIKVKALEREHKYRVALLKEQGATEAQIAQENYNTQIQILDAYVEDYERRYAKYEKELIRIAKIENKEKKKEAEDAADELRKQLISDNERIEDLRNQIRVDLITERQRQNDEDILEKIAFLERQTELEYNAEIKKYEILKALREKLGRQEVIDYKELAKLRNDQKEADEKEIDDRVTNIMSNGLAARTQRQLEQWDKDAKNDKDFKDAQLQAEYALQDAKFEAVHAGLNLLSTLAGKNEALANTLFVIDRAMAIAEVVINTQREISANNKNPFWSTLPDGGKIVKGLANTTARIRAGASIATIAATSIAKFKNGGGNASSVGGGMPSVGSSAPITPQLPMAQTTNLSQQTINDIGNQAVRAYVVESDVTSSQERITAIRQRARFS
jgi:hypothetical protein